MKAILLSVLLLGASSLAWTEEPLTWEKCIQEALRGNPDLVEASYRVASFRANFQGSYSPLMPQLSADVASSIGESSSESHSASVSVTQSLFSGGRNRANIQRAQAEFVAAEASLAAIKAQVGAELKSAFAQMLFAQEQFNLTQSIGDRRDENVELVELRYEAGREHQGSFLRIKASAAQAHFEVSQAERALRVAQRELARVMGRSSLEGIGVTGEFKVTPRDEKLPDFGKLARQTPALQEADAQSKAAKSDVDIAKSRFFPDVDATGSFGNESSRHWPPDQNDWSAGIVLTFPFFPGTQTLFDVKEAKAAQQQALANFRSVGNQTAAQLESRFAALEDAVQRVGVRREFLAAADLRAEIARAQYTTGLLSFEDWDLIENDLIDNQKTMLASLRDAVLAEASWEQTLGKGTI